MKRKKVVSIIVLHACCTFIVHLRVFDDVLLQITQRIYGELISVCVNENDFSATFMRSILCSRETERRGRERKRERGERD